MNNTKARRESLGALMANGEACILFANQAQNLRKFSQDNNFLYFTGLNIPNAILLLIKNADAMQEMLFIERGIPEREVWDGKKMTKEEAQEISEIKRVLYLDEYDATLSMWCPLINKIHANIGYVALDQPLNYALFRMEPLRVRFPQILFADITPLITPLRKVKDAWEIEQLQKAIDITGTGILDIIQQARASMYEYELEAMLFYRMQRSGAHHWGFAPIIASGINAATLHYGQNNCQIEEGQLVLMDVGAAYNNYSADITRCFPISESFSERQKQIYQLVLNAQKEIIEMIKPGVTLMDLQVKTRELLAESALEIELIKDLDEITKYYMHGVSHFLGLDTHDLGGRNAVLEVGNVITVEPGIYIPEENLGVRIEDDVLVTEDGHYVLSHNIPKEISEIEEIRSKALS
ncbi:MAG TPA: aminopeptidase P family protein [Candidatus Cloacimonadota bacterium]|nr:aminopeptidase P family protein [Candidatus Cloacimonadota bacterium]